MSDMEGIRAAKAQDREALYAICLATGSAGEDASRQVAEGSLYGHLYAGPYLALQPDFAWVVEDAAGVCGYVLATPDTATFYTCMETAWLPALRLRYAGLVNQSDRALLAQLNSRWEAKPQLAAWPAHLHIDLLPRAQGRGLGRRLMCIALAALAQADVHAAHVGVDPRNKRALAWYQRFGFRELYRQPGCVWLVCDQVIWKD
ncbi:GNAT family N-acetyltransferase [Chitinimonas sp. PSY-7]|uniref:GNAT family N-acetyltransferase n=1 Tax=Chitinimonas sp. PSY-7 TaxID=3459088 RepID=UPI00403FF6A0